MEVTYDLPARKRLLAYMTRGIVLQRRLSGNEPDTFLQIEGQLAPLAMELADEPDADRRAARIRAVPVLSIPGRNARILLAVTALEAAAALLALTDAFTLF